MGGKIMKNEGLGLFKARKKNGRKWLEGYYAMVRQTAGYGIPVVRHYIIFQKAHGMGRICRVEIDPCTLCRCTGVRDKNHRLIFEHDVVRRKIWGEDVVGEVIWSDIGLTGFFWRLRIKTMRVYPIATRSAGAGLTMMKGISIMIKSSETSLTALKRRNAGDE